MSKAGRIVYQFVQGSSVEDLAARSEPLRLAGWDAVGEPRAVEVKVPGRGLKVCFTQTYARSTLAIPRCAAVHGGLDEPRSNCLPVSPCDHFVQIYEDENSLLDRLQEFVTDALALGEATVLIATPEHLQQLATRLENAGFNLDHKRYLNQYITLDAAATLKRFIVDGWPDQKRFEEVVGGVLKSARRGGRRVRAFGEMVSLLWADGKRSAALHLEDLWHPLCERERFPLFCAYPKDLLAEGNFDGLAAVCAAHSRVF